MKRFFVWLLRPVVKEILKEEVKAITVNNVSVSANDPRVDELMNLFGMGSNLEVIVNSHGK